MTATAKIQPREFPCPRHGDLTTVRHFSSVDGFELTCCWLRDPEDTRTAGELRAALRGMGDGVHPKPVPETCVCDCRCEEPAEDGELCLGCKSFEAS